MRIGIIIALGLVGGGVFMLMNRQAQAYDPSKFNPAMTDDQLIQFWGNAPGIENVVGGIYYAADGSLYRYSGDAYWQEKDGSWRRGVLSTGEIFTISAPPWLT